MAPAKKVLVVDDDPAIRRLVRAWLEVGDVMVLEATNGEEAVQIAAIEAPDVILLDIAMPVLNGIDACRRLRELPTTANVPIIMLTAKGMVEDRRAAKEAGATRFITKPFSPLALRMEMRAYLEEKPAETKPGREQAYRED